MTVNFEIPGTVTNTIQTRCTLVRPRNRQYDRYIHIYSDNDILVTMFICLFMNWNKSKPDYTHLFTSKTICSQYEHACVERRRMSVDSKTKKTFTVQGTNQSRLCPKKTATKLQIRLLNELRLIRFYFDYLSLLPLLVGSRRSSKWFQLWSIHTTFNESTRWRALGSYTHTLQMRTRYHRSFMICVTKYCFD